MQNVFVQRNLINPTLITRVLGLVCVCVLSGLILFAQPANTEAVNLGTWSAVATSSASDNDDSWTGVAYGNKRFVAVGTGTDRVMYSDDGLTWTATTAAGDDDSWTDVTFGNGLFVAVGTGPDRTMTSADGISWFPGTAADDDDSWQSVTYSDPYFIAVGTGPDRFMRSFDGTSWTAEPVVGDDDSWLEVANGNGRFVAIADDAGSTDYIMYSADAFTWESTQLPAGNDEMVSVSYGNNRFIIVTLSGAVYQSPDGIVWSLTTTFANHTIMQSLFANGLFIVMGEDVSSNPVVFVSPDGLTWSSSSLSIDPTTNFTDIAYGAGRFVAVADSGNRVVTAASDVWSLAQTGFQFRNDNGSEVTATSIKGQNSTLEFPLNVPVRLRTQIDSLLATTTTPYYLQYKNTGSESDWHTVGVDDPFPYIRSSWSSFTSSDVTTHNLQQTQCLIGDLNLVIFSHDGVETSRSTSTGWVKLGEASNAVAVTGAIYYKFADGNDNLVVTTSAAEQASYVSYCIGGAGTPTATAANGDSTNSDAPLHRTDAVRNQLFFITRSGDGTTVATSSPAGYSNLLSQAALSGNGASTDVAYRYLTASTTDPAAFNSATEQWVAWTIAVPPRQTPTVGTLEAAVNFTPATSTNNNGYGSIAWTNPGRATSSDQLRATLAVSSTTASNYLNVTQWGFAIPSNATITGITATVEKSQSGGTSGFVRDNSIRLIKGGTVTGNNYASTTGDWLTTEYISTYGTSSNLWGTTWTPAEINATNFGIAVAVAGSAAGANRVANIDHVTLNVYYTVPAPFRLASSSNIATNGASTTARMIAPTIHTKADFSGGHITEDQTPTPKVTISESSYTELEWSLIATGTASTSDNFEFRTSIGLDAPVESNIGNIIFTIAPTTTTAFITLSGTAYTDLGSTTVAAGQEIILAMGETNPVLYSTTTSSGGAYSIRVATSTGSTFVPVSTDKSNDTIISVAYGRGRYVALTPSDIVLTSKNGVKWTRRLGAGATTDWKDITYGEGLFVAVGAVSSESVDPIMYSEDGINWQTANPTISFAQSWTSVTYGKGRFVAVGEDNDRAMYSDDGINWTAIDSGVAGDDDAWSSVTYGNKRFTAVSTSGNTRVMTSFDGITWNARSAAGDNDNWTGITYGNGRFIAIGNGGGDRAMYSSDGISWTAATAAGNDDAWSSVKYGNGRYLAIGKGGDNRAMSSLDGINWTAQATRKNNHNWNKVTFGNGKFIIVGNPTGGDKVTTLDPGIGPDTAVVVYRKATSSPSTTFIGGLDGLSTLAGIPLYGNTMLVYNATTSATTSVTSLDDLAFYDSSDDSNVLYTASSTGPTTINADLIVATGTTAYTGSNFTTNEDLEIREVLSFDGARGVVLAEVNIATTGELIAPSNELTIVGDYTNNGLFTHNNGTTTFRGLMGYGTKHPRFDNSTTTDGAGNQGLFMSDDGVKLYKVDSAYVKEYTLTSPFDVSSGSLTTDFYVEFTIESFSFANDGRKMYVGIWQDGVVYEYTLSTPWSLASATFVATSSPAGSDAFETNIFVTNNGEFLYATDYSPQRITQYRLSTPFSIQSAVLIASSTVDENANRGLWLSPDGEYLIRGMENSTGVKRYRLTKPWDITTIVYDDNSDSHLNDAARSFGGGESVVNIWMDATGRNLLVGSGDGVIALFGLGAELNGAMTGTSSFSNVVFLGGKTVFNGIASTTNVEVSGAVVIAPTSTLSIAGNYTNYGTFDHSSFDGEVYFTGLESVLLGDMSGASRFNNVKFTGSSTLQSSATVHNLVVETGGSLAADPGVVFEVSGNYANNGTSILGTSTVISNARGFNVTDGVEVSFYDLSAQTTNPKSISFSATGTYMYVADNVTEQILAYRLGVPWEVTTAQYLYATTTTPYAVDVTSVRFKPDGTRMFVADYDNDHITEWSLSTPWDIRTTSFFATSTLSDNGWQSMDFSGDGRKLYVGNIHSNGLIRQFTMSTPWDLSTKTFTASYNNFPNFSEALDISDDGSLLFQDKLGVLFVVRLVVPNDLSTAQVVGRFEYPVSFPDERQEMTFNASGTKMYVVESYDERVHQFDLTDAQTFAGTMTDTSALGNFIATGTLPMIFTTAASTNDFSIATTSVVNAPTSTLTVAGNFENRGTFIPRAGTTILSGIDKTIAGNLTSWNDATGPDYGLTNVTGAYTYIGNGTTSAVSIDVAGALTAPAGGTLAVSHNFTNNGTFTNNGATTTLSGNFVGSAIGTSALGNTIVNARSQALGWQPFATTSVVGSNNNDGWESITYGNGRYVVVGGYRDVNVMYSDDGVNWTGAEDPGNDAWSSVTYGNGLFVAVGNFGNRVMTSPDGITWTARTAAGNNDDWSGVTFGNGRFVAVGNSGDRVMYSNDGITWATTSAAGNNDSWSEVVYGNGRFVAVEDSFSNSDKAMYSNDGITWATTSIPNAAQFYGLTYGNGRFVTVGAYTGHSIAYSFDGITWSSVDQGDYWVSVNYGNGYFVAVDGGRAGYSTDGITWATTSVASSNTALRDIIYVNGRFTAVGDGGDNRLTIAQPSAVFNQNASTSNLTISASSTLNASGTSISVAGNYINSGTLAASSSTFIFNGTSTQVATGTMTASSSFYNLIIANTSADGITNQSVQFGAPVSATGTMTILASTSARFAASSTNTFNNVTWQGATSSPVWLRSSVPGTQWNLNIKGTQALSFVDVEDSNATLTISGVENTSGYDRGNNINWNFGDFAPVWNSEDWVLYDTITIQQENIDADLTDFPVYINMADLSPQFWNTVSTTAGDIRIMTDDLTTELPREIVSASTTLETGELHFKANYLSSTTNTTFRIYYNGVASDYADTATYGAENVWTNDFVAVYHLEEDPSGGVGAVIDSTRFNHDGTGSTTMTSADLVTGKVGRGFDFDGTLTDQVVFATSSNFANLNTVSVCTWYEHDNYVGSYGQLVDKSSDGTDSWNFYLDNNGDFGFQSRAGGVRVASNTPVGAWEYLCAAANGAAGANGMVLYRDGLNAGGSGQGFGPGSDDTNTPLTIGSGKTAYRLNGRMDEVRIASTTRAAEWIKAEYYNQSTTTDFYTTASVSTAVVALGNHPLGQVTNTFSGSSQSDEPLFAFTLTPTAESASTTVTLTLTNNIGLDGTNLSDWRLYRDSNENQTVDGGDVQVGGAGTFSTTSVLFTTPFLASISQSYIVTADISNIELGDRLTISLSTDSIIATSTASGSTLPIVGAVSSTNHLRSKKSGGGGSVNFINIGAPGNGIETGGGNTGGEELGGLPNFNPPTANGSPHNQWTSGASGYLSDGAYATETAAGERQSYGTYGFNIPNNNEITGIEVKLEASASTPAGTIEVALSWDNGTSITTTRTTATLSTTDTIYTLGSPSDLWGRAWVPSEFANGTFGLRIIGQPSGGNTVRVDAMQVRVYNQASGGGSGGGGGEL